jgi:hypothetical protein
LLCGVVEVFALAKLCSFRFLLIVLPNCCSIGATLIDVD